jgi:uncharacterized coiled-coil protein SlyX
MADDALERFETKLAFLERASAELGEEVFRQRREIEALRARLAALSSRLEAAAAAAPDADPLQERPPHY